MKRVALCVLLFMTSLLAEENRPPRRIYNEALKALGEGKLEDASRDFLEARNHAGPDQELRFRAAFNLGMTFAAEGDTKKEDAEAAMTALRQGAAWFRDAVRLRPEGPDGTDARINLEIVLRRIQRLADQLNKGQNGLEARLDRLIEDQRGTREEIRKLMGKIAQAGVAKEPISFQEEFREVATRERTLIADANGIVEMSGEEISALEDKKEEELTDADKMRKVELANLEVYMNKGRQSMVDTQRLLKSLQADQAHRQADVALAELKRAREQLEDPVTVLKGLAQDEAVLLAQTERRIAPGEVPPWLSPEYLGEGQKGVSDRAAELLARLEAGASSLEAKEGQQVDAGATAPSGGPNAGATAPSGGPNAGATAPSGGPPAAASEPNAPEAMKTRELLAEVRAAIPLLDEARHAMELAHGFFANSDFPAAQAEQVKSLVALARAIERFANIRQLIELAYAEQTQVVAILENKPAKTSKTDLADAVTRNLERISRLKGMFASEMAALANGAARSNQSGAQDPDKQEAQRELYQRAEEARAQAEEALFALTSSLNKSDAIPRAKDAQSRIEELRRLFLSIVEHMKELLRAQAETHDQTASASARADDGAYAPLGEKQGAHAGLADALAEALKEQAAEGQAQGSSAGDPAQALADAASLVTSAAASMREAASSLTPDPSQGVSPDVGPILDDQRQALEYLANAIKILEPREEPQQNQDDRQEQQNQGSDGAKDKEQVSREQAARQMQAIRDREAERRRDKAKPAPTEPVEKDW